MYQLFTDGSCKGNPGPGGWAYLLKKPGLSMEQAGSEANTTNNRMELMAVIMGLKFLPLLSEVNIVTDSTYVITVAHSPKHHGRLANSEMVDELRQLIRQHHVTFEHVMGHSGHPENEYVDKLASAAAKGKIGFKLMTV